MKDFTNTTIVMHDITPINVENTIKLVRKHLRMGYAGTFAGGLAEGVGLTSIGIMLTNGAVALSNGALDKYDVRASAAKPLGKLGGIATIATGLIATAGIVIAHGIFTERAATHNQKLESMLTRLGVLRDEMLDRKSPLFGMTANLLIDIEDELYPYILGANPSRDFDDDSNDGEKVKWVAVNFGHNLDGKPKLSVDYYNSDPRF